MKLSQEEQDLLFQDLCGRLTYGVYCEAEDVKPLKLSAIDMKYKMVHFQNCSCSIIDAPFSVGVKPLLRPMESMTEEECEEYQETLHKWDSYTGTCGAEPTYKTFDFLNRKMFDYRGLIPAGLAIVAPEDLYKNK